MTTINAPPTRTIGSRVEAVGGYASGFDYMRLILAASVLYGHSFVITGDASPFPAWVRWIDSLRSYLVLPMFFSLSGFLVAASLERVRSLRTFLMLRALRIGPALAVEIVLSALVLGPLVTSEPLIRYFTAPEFFRYFLNVAGWIHYQLPGVFEDNHVARTVNGSLWTVPYEAECYVALAVLSFSGALRRPRALVSALILLCLSLLIYFLINGDPQPWRGTATGRQLVIFFLSGVMIYRLRDMIPFSGVMAIASLAVCALTVRSHVLIYLSPFFASYLTVYLGLQRPRKLPLLFTGDYSYGLYLYAFPVQQVLYGTGPAFRVWWANAAASLVLTACFAALSWHAVEKPVLRLKRLLLSRRDRAGRAHGALISPYKTRENVALAADGHSEGSGPSPDFMLAKPIASRPS